MKIREERQKLWKLVVPVPSVILIMKANGWIYSTRNIGKRK